MLFENIFMIRGGTTNEFGYKLILIIFSLLVCIYDFRTNKRKDYFWIFLTGTLIWALAEFIVQSLGTRVFQLKYLFGFDITNALWATILIQGAVEGAALAILGVFFGDRLMNEESRKIWSIIFVIYLSFSCLNPLILYPDSNFLTVDAGNHSIASRRDMFPIYTIILTAILIFFAIYWYITTDDEMARKRARYMFYVMLIWSVLWTFTTWLVGRRWIEIGTLNPDGTYSNLRRAPPLVEFFALAYDCVIEISLMYVPFLAIPYLIRRRAEKSKYLDLKLENKEEFIERWFISKEISNIYRKANIVSKNRRRN